MNDPSDHKLSRAPLLPKDSFSSRHTFLVFLAITLSVCIPLLIGREPSIAQLRSIPGQAIAGLILLFIMKWLFDTIRCQILLKANGINLRAHDTLSILLACGFASELTPAGVGAPAIAIALLKHRKIRTTTTTGVILSILCMDAFSVLLLLSAAAAVPTLLNTDELLRQIAILSLVSICGLTSIAVAIKYQHQIIVWLGQCRILQQVPHKKRKSAATAWLRVLRTLQRLKTLPRPSLFFALLFSLASWICRLSVIFVAITAIGYSAEWSDTVLIQFIIGVSAILTGLPGGIIGADITAAVLLMPIVGNLMAIAAVIVIWRVTTYHLNLAAGGLALAWQVYLSVRYRRQ